jgi:YggT family protein
MDIIFVPVFLLMKAIIGIASAIVIADVVLGWLIIANIFNTSNKIVYAVIDSISRISCLMLDPVRKRMPINIGIDISPVVVLLVLTFVDNVIGRILLKFM